MFKYCNDPKDMQHLLLTLLSTSGTLAGLSMALVGLVNLRIASEKVESIADDLILFTAVGFLLVCILVFFALRQLHSTQLTKLKKWTMLIDLLFLGSLALLVVSGFIVLYTFSWGTVK